VAIDAALEHSLSEVAAQVDGKLDVPNGGAGRLHGESRLNISQRFMARRGLESLSASDLAWLGGPDDRTSELPHEATLLFGPRVRRP
jgi:hypothetical protein